MNEKQTQTPAENLSETSSLLQPEREPLSEAERKIRQTKIRTLNDSFRTTFLGGQVVVTQGFQALRPELRSGFISDVQNFSEFTEGNDPYEEHDFGIIKNRGETVYWKIDYYDKALQFGSEAPSDPEATNRVLTIMLASEY